MVFALGNNVYGSIKTRIIAKMCNIEIGFHFFLYFQLHTAMYFTWSGEYLLCWLIQNDVGKIQTGAWH